MAETQENQPQRLKVADIVRENIEMKAHINTFIDTMSEIFASFGMTPEEMGENPNMMSIMGKLTKKFAAAEMRGEELGGGALAKLNALQPIIDIYKHKKDDNLKIG